MADRHSRNVKTGEEDIRNISTRSDFSSVSGNSAFLYVSGNSEYLFVGQRGSSTIRSDTALSEPQTTDEGSSFIHSTLTYDPENGSDNDPEKGSDFEPEKGFDNTNVPFLKPADTTPLSVTPKCSSCASDEKHIQATNICWSCATYGVYLCYRCLQSHNRWHHDHIVDTLSASDKSLSRTTVEDCTETERPEDYERENVSYDTLHQACTVQADSDLTTTYDGNASANKYKTTKTMEQEKERLEKTTTSGFNSKNKERSEAYSNVKQRFFQDKLYTDIIKDMQCMKLGKLTKLQKYGTYSVKSLSDPKRSIITSICKLESGHLILADSENCSIKIVKGDNYQLISSHNVEGHPALLCFIEADKFAVAFADNIIKIVLIEKEVQVANSFEIKRCCTGLTFGKGNLYVCFSERIDVYSETGEKRNSFRPLIKSNPDQKFVHLHKITINKDKDTLYIANRENGIIVADTSGSINRIIAQYIAEPDSICPDESGFLFVTEVSSDRVLKINSNDGSVIQELKEVSKNAHPISLCHDSITNRLIVGVWSSNDIHVYTCT